MAAQIVGVESDAPLYGVWASAGVTAFTVPLNHAAKDFEDAELIHDGYNDGVLMTMENVEGADVSLSCVEIESEPRE